MILTDIDGRPILANSNSKDELKVKTVLVSLLINRKVDVLDSLKSYDLATKIFGFDKDEIELDDTDFLFIKKAVEDNGVGYFAGIIGQIYKLLLN